MSSPTFELKNTLVRAGAGAGKTTELVARVLDYASRYHEKNGKWPRLVVCTFTRKATQELKERILVAAMSHPLKGLIEFAESPSHLHISTIHGVLSLLLSQYGWFDGLVPAFQFIGRDQERVLIKKLIRQSLKSSDNQDFLNLSEHFHVRELLEMFELARREDLNNVRSLSFEDLKEIAETLYHEARKSILHVADEIESQIGDAGKVKSKQNFLDWAKSIRQLPESLPQAEQLELFFAELPKTANRGEIISEDLNQRKKDLTDSIKEMAEASFQQQSWNLFSDIGQNLLSLFQRLSADLSSEKKRTAVLTMSDLEDFSWDLCCRVPEVVKNFSQQWDYWMIDEFQDTSPKQVQILKVLMGDCLQYYVGDPQQSIYLFRGARSEVFFQQEEQIAKAAGLLQKKMMNYRSEKSLLYFFNWFFKNLGSQFSEMQAGNTKLHAEEQQATVVQSEHLEDDQLGLVAVQNLLQQGVSPTEILVLGRTNDLLAQCGARLAEAQVPYQILSGGQFFEKREVLDALALLKFLVAPQDSSNLVALIRSPFFWISESLIQKIRQDKSAQSSLWTQLQLLDHEVVQKLKSYLNSAEQTGLLNAWREALFQESYLVQLRQQDPSGRKESNLFKLLHSVFSAERKPDFSVSQFLHRLELGQEDPESAEGETLPVIAPEKVNLMTIHASKGLQSPYVILLGCGKKPPSVSKAPLWISEKDRALYFALNEEDGQRHWAPGYTNIKDEWRRREIEEFDRLLYVALTRAEKSVSLVCSGVQSGSWAERWILPKEEGRHNFENFSILVQNVTEQSHFKFEAQKSSDLRSITLPQSSIQQSRNLQTMSVTALIDPLTRVSEDQSPQKPTPSSQSKGSQEALRQVKRALRGVEIHRIFERLKYTGLDLESQDISEDLKINLRNILADSSVPLAEIIQRGSVEWGFGAKIAGHLVQGQIDLWGEAGAHDLWIVDYKTGNPAHSEKAFLQLQVYALALKKVGKIKKSHKVNLCVLYPFDSNPFRVKNCPAFEEIESRIGKN